MVIKLWWGNEDCLLDIYEHMLTSLEGQKCEFLAEKESLFYFETKNYIFELKGVMAVIKN